MVGHYGPAADYHSPLTAKRTNHSLRFRELLLDAGMVLDRLARAEVLQLEHLADLDLALPQHRVRATLDPLDRLLEGVHLPEPEAGDQLLGLGEGTVDDGA